MKYACGQCNYQATQKRDLAKHKRAVHETALEKKNMKVEKNLETISENYDSTEDELEKANRRNRTLEDLNNEQTKRESDQELIKGLVEEVSSLESENST